MLSCICRNQSCTPLASGPLGTLGGNRGNPCCSYLVLPPGRSQVRPKVSIELPRRFSLQIPSISQHCPPYSRFREARREFREQVLRHRRSPKNGGRIGAAARPACGYERLLLRCRWSAEPV